VIRGIGNGQTIFILISLKLTVIITKLKDPNVKKRLILGLSFPKKGQERQKLLFSVHLKRILESTNQEDSKVQEKRLNKILSPFLVNNQNLFFSMA